MGACLGDLPRLGALDDHTLHPSPSDFSLRREPNRREEEEFWDRKALGHVRAAFTHRGHYCTSGKYRLWLLRVKHNKLEPNPELSQN